MKQPPRRKSQNDENERNHKYRQSIRISFRSALRLWLRRHRSTFALQSRAYIDKRDSLLRFNMQALTRNAAKRLGKISRKPGITLRRRCLWSCLLGQRGLNGYPGGPNFASWGSGPGGTFGAS